MPLVQMSGGWEAIPIEFATEAQAKAYCDKRNTADARKLHWKNIWRQAWNNMPQRKGQTKTTTWEPLEKKLPLPEYIKGNVQKKPRYKIIDGLVYERHVDIRTYYYGQSALLARLLGYYNKPKNGKPRHPHNMRIATAMSYGQAPRDQAKRDLLTLLASPAAGPTLAREMCKKLGIIHLYEP